MKRDFKKIFIENKGNIISTITVVLIFSFILVGVLVLETSNYINDDKASQVESNNFEYIVSNYKSNIPLLSQEIINQTSMNIIQSKNPLTDSREELKNKINQRLIEENAAYYNNYKITITSEVVEVSNDESPFYIDVKTKLTFKKDDIIYNSNDSFKISVVGLSDPLPFIKCKIVEVESDKINYRHSLKNYLDREITDDINTQPYINSKSPLTIKECPYQPYNSHGINNLCGNCILNGYFHESHDGSCYLCRMEGRGNCSHYGLETFIVPGAQIENNTTITSIDHVIYSENPYPGDKIHLNNSSDGNFIFLDNGHKSKYGFI